MQVLERDQDSTAPQRPYFGSGDLGAAYSLPDLTQDNAHIVALGPDGGILMVGGALSSVSEPTSNDDFRHPYPFSGSALDEDGYGVSVSGGFAPFKPFRPERGVIFAQMTVCDLGRPSTTFATPHTESAVEENAHGVDISSNFASWKAVRGLAARPAGRWLLAQPTVATTFRPRGHRIGMSYSGIRLLKDIAERLSELAEHAREDGTEICASSRQDFVRFVNTQSVTRRPALSILDSGTIRAVWKNKEREQVAIHFKGGGDVNFVIFELSGGEMHRSYGRSSLRDVPRIISDSKLWRLLVNEG